MATVDGQVVDGSTIVAMNELLAIARRAFKVGLQIGTGGNISIRVGNREQIVIKASGVGFSESNKDNLLVVDYDGRILRGNSEPTSDMAFHLGIYRVRSDVGGIIHVHSPWATSWSASGIDMPLPTVHSRAKLIRVPVIPTAPDGGTQRADEVVKAFCDTAIIAALLANHGALGVGRTLLAAEHVVELIEETAHVAAIARLLAITPNPNVLASRSA